MIEKFILPCINSLIPILGCLELQGDETRAYRIFVVSIHEANVGDTQPLATRVAQARHDIWQTNRNKL